MEVYHTNVSQSEKMTGEPLVISDNPKDEIIQILGEKYGLID